MTKSKIKIATSLVESSSSYKCGNVNYSLSEDRISIFGKEENLYSTDIVAMFDNIDLFGSFLQYNKEEQRIELIIY